jgi:hypothetical protein
VTCLYWKQDKSIVCFSFPCPPAQFIVLVKNINVAQTQFWVLFCMFWACTWATLSSPVMHVLGLYLGNTFESCYAGLWACNGWGLYPLQAKTVHNRTRMCVWEAANTCCLDKWAIKGKKCTSAFVLPIIVFHQPSLLFILGHKCQQQDYVVFLISNALSHKESWVWDQIMNLLFSSYNQCGYRKFLNTSLPEN